jgi:putative sugar O-methyltransferase
MTVVPFELSASLVNSLESTKRLITAMLDERKTENQSSSSPSDYWLSFCSAFDYMLDLTPRSLAKIRLHTYHLTSDNYLTYFFEPTTIDPIWFRNKLSLEYSDIPQALLLSEPRQGGMGINIDGRLVSTDIGRFQQVVSTLYRAGVLSKLQSSTKRTLFLEIGAGYGGLAYQIKKIVENSTYFIIDLPEVLFFSACYLQLAHPDKKFFIYDPSDIDALSGDKDWLEYDFIFLPNYRKDFVRKFRFDLVVNMESLQEMRHDQVTEYLDLIHEVCQGHFYSLNQDRNVKNLQLQNLSEMLQNRFDVTEMRNPNLHQEAQSPKTRIRRLGKSTLVRLGVLSRPPVVLPHLEYLCVPR